MRNSYSGVYCLRNLLNDKRYVGSSVNLHNRKRTHFYNLKNDINENEHLRSAYKLYGKENFIFEILEYCEEDEFFLAEREDYWVSFYRSNEREFGYNIRKVVISNLGWHHSEESKNKMSNSRKGLRHSEETKKKMSENGKKRKNSEETRRKISDARRGTVASDETKDKMSENNRGENNSHSVLTEGDVREIRIMIKNGMKNTEIAKFFDVKEGAISKIRTGRTWKNIE